MIQINAFSVVDLLSAISLLGMSVALLYRYWRVTQRPEDALLAGVLFCFLFYSLESFAADNIVPSGMPAGTIANGGATTLIFYRLMYVAATFGALALIHFGLRYCQSDRLP